MQELNILLTSGGVETALNISKALKRSCFNCRIISADMDPSSIGQYFSDKNYIIPPASEPSFIGKIKQIVDDESIDFIFPCHSSEISIFCEHKDYFIDAGAGLILPNLLVERICSDKKEFIKFLDLHNFHYSKIYNSFEDVEAFPIFIRPKSGSSSKGTMKVGSRSGISSEMIQLEQNFIIQDYISAQEITIDAYINSKKNFFTCMPRTRNKVKDGKSVVGQTLNDKKIYEIAKSLLEKLDYQGACNIQLFNDNNLNIIEINPRMSAGGLLLSCEAGLNIPELMLLDYFNYDLPAIGMPLKPITMIRYLDEKFIR